MSEKTNPAHHHFPTPPKFLAPFQKGETHGFLGVVFGDASDPSDGLEDEYESTYGIQEVDNGIKMGFVTTTKYHGMQERQPCHMLAVNSWDVLLGYPTAVAWYLLYIHEISCQASSFNQVDGGHRLACS